MLSIRKLEDLGRKTRPPFRLHRTMLALVALLFFAVMSSGLAARADQGGCKALVGAYLITVTGSTGNVSSHSIVTLAGDGSAFVVDSNEGGVSGVFNPFTGAHGSWSCHGGHPVTGLATVLDFTLPGSEGSGQSIARTDYQISPGSESGTISGAVDLRFFPLDANPLVTPLPPPNGTFTFTGIAIK